PEPAGLLAEIGKDRMRLGDRQIAVGQHRDAAERVQRQEVRLPLLTFGEVERHDLAIEPQFLQRKRDLLRIGRREMIQLHSSAPHWSCVRSRGCPPLGTPMQVHYMTRTRGRLPRHRPGATIPPQPEDPRRWKARRPRLISPISTKASWPTSGAL